MPSSENVNSMTFRIAAESSANNNFLPVNTWIFSLALFAVGPSILVCRVWPYCERSTHAKSESRVFLESWWIHAGFSTTSGLKLTETEQLGSASGDATLLGSKP